MKQSLLVLAVLFCSSVSFVHAQSSRSGDISYPLLYERLSNPRVDSAGIAAVSNLTIRRDAATFNLGSGTLVLCAPIGGRTCAAVFVGEGNYRFVPSTAVERASLARFFKTESMSEPVAGLFLVFADSTLEELRRSLTFTRAAVPEGVAAMLDRTAGFITDPDARSIDREFATALLNEDRNDLFYAHILTPSGDQRFFQINPYEEEEVSFMRRGQIRSSAFREPVSMAHYQHEYADDPRPEDKRGADVEHYRVECRMENDLSARFTAEVTLRSLAEKSRWIDFSLYYKLRIDSMVWSDGVPASFYQTPEMTFWVKIPPAGSGSQTLKIFYGGSIMERQRDWTILKSSTNWYPYHHPKDKATFDLTFRTPDYMKFASIGTMVSSAVEGDLLVTHWKSQTPVRNASFNLGVFQEQKFTPDSVAPITVHRGPESSGGMGEQIGWDVENSIRFYEHLYGRLPYDHFYVTEIPALHGEAFPGLIHLSVATFLRNDKTGYGEIFRAHEVAHQWWGIGVDFQSYHDQWLSEGFSEYSGMMYMQAVLKDNEKFFRRLNDYKWELLNNRKSLIGDAQQAGPVWLGYRTSSSTSAGDYDLVIYKKGAWVLHMLRNYLLDLNTMKEDRYRSMMREFFSAYQGKTASTEDFQRMVEKHAGANMGWFFKQWVYGTAIPTYTWATKVEEAPGGKYKVTLRVRQANVPPDFQMVVPVKIDFGGGKAARVRVTIRGAVSEQVLPLMPLEPEEIVFNDLESVLCESEEEKW